VARNKKSKGASNPAEVAKSRTTGGEAGEAGVAGDARPATSRNREESMKESGDDAFQNPRSSGTTPLGGESQDADPDPEQLKQT